MRPRRTANGNVERPTLNVECRMMSPARRPPPRSEFDIRRSSFHIALPCPRRPVADRVRPSPQPRRGDRPVAQGDPGEPWGKMAGPPTEPRQGRFPTRVVIPRRGVRSPLGHESPLTGLLTVATQIPGLPLVALGYGPVARRSAGCIAGHRDWPAPPPRGIPPGTSPARRLWTAAARRRFASQRSGRMRPRRAANGNVEPPTLNVECRMTSPARLTPPRS